MRHYESELEKRKIYLFACPDLKAETHSHPYLELVYVLEGEATHCWDNEEKTIRPGDYFFIDYHSKHSYYALGERFQIINCLFLPEFIDTSLLHCSSFQTVISNYQIQFKTQFFTANPSASVFQDETGEIRSLLLGMLSEFDGKEPGYLQMIRSKLIEILVLTMRKIYLAPQAETNSEVFNRALNYINHNYMYDIKLGDICKDLGYSLPYLSMKFKSVFGIGYVQYLQKLRVEHAMRLLVHTEKSVAEVAQCVGYHDLKAFYSVFRKFADVSPAQFRRCYEKGQM